MSDNTVRTISFMSDLNTNRDFNLRIMETLEDSDMTIKLTNNVQLDIHYVVVAAKYPYFTQQHLRETGMDGNGKERTILALPIEFHEEGLRALLRFAYGAELTVGPNNAEEIYLLAKLCQNGELTQKTCHFIEDTTSADNVVQRYTLGVSQHEDTLMNQAKKVAHDQMAAIIEPKSNLRAQFWDTEPPAFLDILKAMDVTRHSDKPLVISFILHYLMIKKDNMTHMEEMMSSTDYQQPAVMHKLLTDDRFKEQLLHLDHSILNVLLDDITVTKLADQTAVYQLLVNWLKMDLGDRRTQFEELLALINPLQVDTDLLDITAFDEAIWQTCPDLGRRLQQLAHTKLSQENKGLKTEVSSLSEAHTKLSQENKGLTLPTRFYLLETGVMSLVTLG